MKSKFIKGFLLVCLVLFMMPLTTAAKEQEITYELKEEKENHQFIISGKDNDFEVKMILPDGTVVDHEEFDPNKYMYFSLENERIWAVNKSSKGTYTFKVTSDKDARFSVRTKDSIERPELKWKSPKDEKISMKAGEEIELTWEGKGDFSSTYSNMKIMLKQKDNWHLFEVGTTGVGRESYKLSLPNSIPSGEYELYILLDDKLVIDKEINPEVIIDYQNPEFEPDHIEIVEQIVENGMFYLIIEVPKYTRFDRLEAAFNKQGEKEQYTTSIAWNSLDLYKNLDDTKQYLWSVSAFEDDGDYEGSILAIVNEKKFSEPLPLEPFSIHLVAYNEEQIEWSIAEGVTNAASLDITVDAPKDTIITVIDSGEVLAQKQITEDDHVISAPLKEGHRVIEVELSDGGQNSATYTRNFQVDHTPPTLEMIQPLATHDTLTASFASGYVELGSTLEVNGKEVAYDEETGYFRVDINDKLNIELTSQSGNTVDYTWAENNETETGSNWLLIVLINIGIISSVAGIIVYLRKTKK